MNKKIKQKMIYFYGLKKKYSYLKPAEFNSDSNHD